VSPTDGFGPGEAVQAADVGSGLVGVGPALVGLGVGAGLGLVAMDVGVLDGAGDTTWPDSKTSLWLESSVHVLLICPTQVSPPLAVSGVTCSSMDLMTMVAAPALSRTSEGSVPVAVAVTGPEPPGMAVRGRVNVMDAPMSPCGASTSPVTSAVASTDAAPIMLASVRAAADTEAVTVMVSRGVGTPVVPGNCSSDQPSPVLHSVRFAD
jgi:hypothetical protein